MNWENLNILKNIKTKITAVQIRKDVEGQTIRLRKLGKDDEENICSYDIINWIFQEVQ